MITGYRKRADLAVAPSQRCLGRHGAASPHVSELREDNDLPPCCLWPTHLVAVLNNTAIPEAQSQLLTFWTPTHYRSTSTRGNT